jgi:hypothetical protein
MGGHVGVARRANRPIRGAARRRASGCDALAGCLAREPLNDYIRAMSLRSPFAAAWLVVSCALTAGGCSGSSEQSLDNLASGRRDAAADSAPLREPTEAEADAADAVAANASDAEEPSAEVDAGAAPATDEDAGDDANALDAAPSDAVLTDASANAATTEAGAPDAADEAGDAAAQPEDASVPRLRLTLTRAGEPVPQAYVVYHGVEQQAIGEGSTDEAGVAQSELDVMALSVVLPRLADSNTIHLFTYFGVQPGDDLKLALPGTDDAQPSYALALTPQVAAVRYDASGGPGACLRGGAEGSEPTLTLTNRVGCLAPQGNAVLVAAFRAPNDVPVLSGYALASGLAAPGAAGPLQVAVGAFQSFQDVHLVGHELPQDVSASVRLNALLGDQRLPLSVKGGVRAELSAGANDVEFGVPSFAFDAFLAQADYIVADTQTSLSWRSATSSTASELSFDFAHALPPFRDFLVDMDPSLTTRVYWNSDASSERDGYLFEVRLYSRDGGGSPLVIWSGLVPPAAQQARFPSLPQDLAALIPKTEAHYWRIERITEIGDSTVADYDALRQRSLLYVRGGAHLTELSPAVAGHTALGSYGRVE